jgi:hypothetical protein
LLTRSIDPIGPTIEERILLGAKRLCILFAGGALTLSALDLMNIRSVDSAGQSFHGTLARVADLPDQIRSGIAGISLSASSPSVTLEIPRERTARAPRPAAIVPVALRRENSPVAELASLRHQDAVEMAMVSPPSFAKSRASMIEPAPAAQIPEAKVQLASADATLPVSAIAPPPPPLSLPMSMSALIPIDMVRLPREAPGPPPPSPAERLKLEGKEYARAERCLATAIYFEARSEPIVGQKAVAQVVINRVFSGFYPNDICGVVYQNAHRRLACQFTFACDGKSKAIMDRGSWARANRIARETLNGHIYVPEVAKSTHYHAVYVHPNWVREMKKMVRYGVHNFYRPIAWGNGAELPAWGSPALMAEKKK